MDNYAIHKANFGFTTNTSLGITSFSYEADGYYGQKGDVTVTFTNGSTYVYEGIYFRDAMMVQMAYMEEESVGRAFDQYFGRVNTGKKVDPCVGSASNNQ